MYKEHLPWGLQSVNSTYFGLFGAPRDRLRVWQIWDCECVTSSGVGLASETLNPKTLDPKTLNFPKP